MATHRISIFNSTLQPDSSGDAFIDIASNQLTTARYDHDVLVFLDTATRVGVYGAFEVPQNFVGTAVLKIVWTANATSNDVEWDFDYRAVGGDDTETLDPTTDQETVNINDTAPSAVFERLEASITLTSANFAAGDMVLFGLFRDGTDAGDTMAADALVYGAYFQYADA